MSHIGPDVIGFRRGRAVVLGFKLVDLLGFSKSAFFPKGDHTYGQSGDVLEADRAAIDTTRSDVALGIVRRLVHIASTIRSGAVFDAKQGPVPLAIVGFHGQGASGHFIEIAIRSTGKRSSQKEKITRCAIGRENGGITIKLDQYVNDGIIPPVEEIGIGDIEVSPEGARSTVAPDDDIAGCLIASSLDAEVAFEPLASCRFKDSIPIADHVVHFLVWIHSGRPIIRRKGALLAKGLEKRETEKEQDRDNGFHGF